MKKSMLLGMLALSATMFAATTAQVDVSANLIKTVEITSQSSTAQLMLTNVQTGDFSFPDTALEITGGPGKAIMLKTPQTLTLRKTGGGSETTIANVTFGEGTITTNGTDARAIQILPASGAIQNTLKISGNLTSALAEGSYRGTIDIEANYN